jgi:hypothetical protein
MVLVLNEVAQTVGRWFLLYTEYYQYYQYYQYRHSFRRSSLYDCIVTCPMFSPIAVHEVFMRSVLFWDLLHHGVIVLYVLGTVGCPKTSVCSYHFAVLIIPEDHRF